MTGSMVFEITRLQLHIKAYTGEDNKDVQLLKEELWQ